MPSAKFRFYAELNDFLPYKQRFEDVKIAFCGRQTVKHLIESIGVPHTEVDLVLVNGKSFDFSYLVKNKDRISVYPVFERFDISPINHLRPEPLRNPKFILDVHLGRLAAYLRLLGFDILYDTEFCDEEIAELSKEQQRICLTRDRGLLKRKLINRGYCLRSTDSRLQLKEVLQRFDLRKKIKPYTRCVHCNGILNDVEKEAILDKIMPGTQEYYDDFKQCADCGQVYWKGSHFDRLQKLIAWAVADEQTTENFNECKRSYD